MISARAEATADTISNGKRNFNFITPTKSLYRRSRSSLNKPPTRSKTPPGARGSSGRARVISALLKPGFTSPSFARAVHQLAAVALDRAPPLRGLGAGGLG